MTFKIGDRVAVYIRKEGRRVGKITHVGSDTVSVMIKNVIYGHSTIAAHPKQCRKLVKKKKEVNINDPKNALACMKMIREFNEAYDRCYEIAFGTPQLVTALDYQNKLKNSVPKKEQK